MRKPIKEVINKYPDVLQITWVINNICSNRCNYCVPALHSGTNHGYTWDNVKNFFEEIFKRYPKIHVSIAGGEPTMSPFLIDLCQMIHEKGSTVGLTSNGVRSVDYYKKLSQYVNYIVFSYHPQYANKDNILSKIEAVVPNCYSALRIMMDPKYWDDAISFYETVKKSELIKYFTTEVVKIIDWNQTDRETLNYSNEQLEWFKNTNLRIDTKIFNFKNKTAKIGADFILEDGSIDSKGDAIDYINEGLADFYGWECNIGLEHLYIFADGNIKRGNCIGFPIGNICNLNELKWPDKPVTCPWHICACSTDVMISKRKSLINTNFI